MASSGWKKVGITFVVLAVLGGMVYFGFNFWLDRSLKQALNSGEDRAFRLDFRSVWLDPDLSGILLRDVEIIPLSNEDQPGLKGRISTLNIEGIEWRYLLFDKTLKIQGLTFEEPSFSADRPQPTSQSSDSSDHQQQISGLFGDILARIHLSEFAVIRGELILTKSGEPFIEIEEIDLSAWGLETDSVLMQKFFPFRLDSLRMDLRGFTSFPDSINKATLGNFHYFARRNDGMLTITDLQFAPVVDVREVVRRRKTEKGVLSLKLDTLQFLDLSPESRVTGKFDIRSQKARIRGLQLAIYKDKNYPWTNQEPKPSFADLIRKIPFPFSLDTLLLEASEIELSIRGNKGSRKEGVVRFASIEGSILNLSNRKEDHGEGSMARVNIDLKINNEIPTKATLDIHYDHEEHVFTARTGAFSFSALNQTIIPLAGIRIESGRVTSLEIHSHARRNKAWNRMDITYEGFKVKILDQRERDPKWLMSVAANTLIHSDRSKSVEATQYTSDRDVLRPPFQFLWLPVRDGFLETMPTNMGKKIIHQRLGT
ncbi:MAG: hypothetical protein LPK46_02250 [Bacteroidota bacterium]|nr:hypothetical protein [Bacteroidota bacterium]MDX5504939.1 hypothetical protein [Bacteroidota bacterium]